MRRLRPLVAVVLTLVVMTPSLVETLTQNLSVVSVLSRLVVSLFLIGCLIWLVTAVMLHYARIQAGRELDTPDEAQTP